MSLRIFGILAALVCVAPAAAQNFPDKPLRIVVPFPAGGSADTISRTLGPALADDLGQQVVVENRPGAGGNIGTLVVAKAPADGYTLLMAPSSIASAPSLYSDLGWDPVKDFAPVTFVGRQPMILVVHPAVPATSVGELIALAKAKPGSLNYASGGNGVMNHLAGELFKLRAGVDLVHVPYRGNPLAMVDVIGGSVPVMFDFMLTAMPHVRGGKVRALAITSLKRSPLLPDLPTVAESGVAEFEASTWFGLYAPAGTPAPVLARLHAAMLKALGQPAAKAKFADLGLDVTPGGPDVLAAETKADGEKWGAIIRQARIKAN